MSEPTIFEKSKRERVAYSLPAMDLLEVDLDTILPSSMRRQAIGLPEVDEFTVVQHIARLGQQDVSVDTAPLYPLGSCTMKYNPRVNELVARLNGFTNIHPLQPAEYVRGALQVMYELQEFIAEISGLPAVTLQPAAGSHGELTGIMVAHAYHEKRGEGEQRRKIVLPDSAHGTNPASATLFGYECVTVASDARGNVDLSSLEKMCQEGKVALFMLTNPNTLGLFDEHLLQVADIVHNSGALLYGDGANMNALVGRVYLRGVVDILHHNLHKTWTVPHGGGGPGAGPLAVSAALAPFLPVPVVVKQGHHYSLDYNRPDSIGPVSGFYGAFGALIRSFTYALSLGPEAVRQIADDAVVNANYLRVKLQRQGWKIAVDRTCMHEVVVSAADLPIKDSANLIAEYLISQGYHPPTVHFPLTVPEALMIEPTESASKEALDAFLTVMADARHVALTNPEALHRLQEKNLDAARASRPKTMALTYDMAVERGLLSKRESG